MARRCWVNFQCRDGLLNLDNSRARAYCACSRCGWGLLGYFSLVYHSSFLSPSLWETARYRLKYCLKGPLSPHRKKHSVPDVLLNLNSRARAYCVCSRCGWGLFGYFSLVYHSSFLSPSLWETAGYRLKYCLKGPLSPHRKKQLIN